VYEATNEFFSQILQKDLSLKLELLNFDCIDKECSAKIGRLLKQFVRGVEIFLSKTREFQDEYNP
jgi:hypothetical protein